MTSVKAHLHTTIAAMALAFGALSAPASATISTPFGVPYFGLGNAGPGAGGYHTGFGIPTPWGALPGPTFGIHPAYAWGMNDQQALSVRTPFGGFSGPGFGLGGPGYPPGVVPFFGLNEQQALSVKTPWGGASIPGFGICNWGACIPQLGLSGAQNVGLSTPFGGFYGPGFGVSFGPFGGNFGGFGMGPQQALNVSTPFGGFYGPGFGVSTPWGGFSGPGFGVSTPWGGVSTPIFGLNGQPMAGGPQIVPVMVPYPVPMQGPMGPAQGGAQPTQCMINAVPALTKSVDDCEKAGGAVPPTRTSAVQEAKKE